MYMKKIIFTALLIASSFTSYSQEFTPKKVFESLKSKDVQDKILNYLEDSRVKKMIDFLDQDLVLNFSKNKVIVNSISEFDFIRINGQQMPRNANFKFSFFNYEFSVSKEKSLITFSFTNH